MGRQDPFCAARHDQSDSVVGLLWRAIQVGRKIVTPGHARKITCVVIDTPIAFGLAHHGHNLLGIEQTLFDQSFDPTQIGGALGQNAVNTNDLMGSHKN